MHNSFSNEESYSKEIIAETSPCEQYIRFEEEIGHGSSKVVYKAIDTFNMCEVVWNTINVSKMSTSDKKRLVTEIELLKKYKHENIMKIYKSYVKKNRSMLKSNFIIDR